jgi:threonine aldolase
MRTITETTMNQAGIVHRSRQLASDTYAGICPEALAAIMEANRGHAPPYGDDDWTARATALLRELFETDCEVFFVATGTAANSLALAALCQPYHSVICHADAHVQTDECGAPEYASRGLKLLPVAGQGGKLDPQTIRAIAAARRDVHSSRPRAVTISQATELGTVYRVEELQALSAAARELGLLVQMDGARFANALATFNVAPRELTWQAGVDVLCFGGTKNGMAVGDAIIFFNHSLAEDFVYRRKQAGQLLAKMRYVAAPWVAMLESGAWLRNARHANALARLLAKEVRTFSELRILYPVEANAVFLDLPPAWAEGLEQRGWHFYTIANGARFMCSWDTEEEDIQALLKDLRAVATT